jgi:predicted CxxxxCH...CXXCH cytochrome family protein
MAAGNYKLCFDCHGLSGSTATDNIARYYPVASQGLGAAASATVHTGHNIKTSGGYLAQYTALPCYDCHATHGSRNGNTQLKSDQRWSNLGDTRSNAANNRLFCLGCHVGYDDAATAGTVENLNRQGANKLKLPAANPIAEHAASNAQSCGACHGGLNVNDNTYGPHYPATGLCDTCHEGQGARSAAAAGYNGAHRTHVDNTGYKLACRQCHSWTATVSPATHKNDAAATQHAEVRFDNQAAGWATIQYATATLYEYRSIYTNPYGAGAAVPTYSAGTDNATPDSRQASVRWTNGSCGVVWCHSNANPVVLTQGVGDAAPTNVYQSPTWVDNSLAGNCTGCHGGDATSGRKIGDNTAPTKGSVVHLKHVNANLGCYKCHSYTVTTSNNRLVNVIDNHVNGTKEVRFSAEVGGTWDNANKTCNGTSCHGTGLPLADWDNTSTVVGCAPCHQSMGAGNSYTYTGVHQTHTDNATYKTACEACHSVASATHPNGIHAGGDNNAATAQYADVFFSDNASIQVYNSRSYYGVNLWSNPYGAAAPSPSYAAGGYTAGDNDAINPALSWTRGNCSTVWCHSNANPLTAAGGVRQNAYRTATWNGTQPCTYCHTGQGTAAAMNTDNSYLSYAHIQHVATDTGYGMTCDDCHAQTVPNDCTVSINGTTGYDNHVNGVKTISFSTTLRTTTISQSAGTWDNTNKTCSATYCHSDGLDNNATGGFSGSVASPRWDNVNIAGCTYCHGGDANTSRPMSSNAHDNHVNNAAVIGINYTCKRCHNATIQNNDNVTLFSRALHVNGIRNVSFDNGGSFASANVTCTNTLCHQQGNAALPAGAGADNIAIAWDNSVNAGCKRCHGSIAGGAVGGYTSNSLFGEPNYDNGINGNGTQNSHAKHVASAVDCRNCHRVTVSGTAIDNAAYAAEHINDNVEVYPGPGVSFTWTAGTHSCASISCHGGNPAVWGASLTCFSCHTGTEQLYKPQPSAGTPNPVDNTQYLSVGHGRTGTNYATTGNPFAGFDNTSPVAECYYCHSTSAAHTTKNANDPYRLGYGADANGQKAGGAVGAWADNLDGLCLKCHGTTAERSGVTVAATVTINEATHSQAIAGNRISVWTLASWKCVDCHDPHGDANIAMVRSGINAPTAASDNVGPLAGSDIKGTPNRTTSISTITFTSQAGYAAGSYAINGADGVCEVCHIQTTLYKRGGTAENVGTHTIRTGNCIACHGHDAGFKGVDGSNREQFFDSGYRADNTSNYRDLSGHRILSNTTTAGLFDGTQVNCYGCHGVAGTNRYANECLKCHWENRTSGTPAHPNGVFEWATPTAPATQFATYPSGTINVDDSVCLACHGTGGGTALNGVSAPIIIPTGESWTGGSGHGSTTTLSGGFAGPPAYHCADCHKSTAIQAGGTARDQVSGGVHGSINRKLVRHDNVASGGQEYPHPSDTFYNTATLRSGRMDNYCASKCHRVAGGQAKDDNVVDHTWDLLGGGVRAIGLSHPSNMTAVPGVMFRAPDNLPLSDSLVSAPPAGTGNEVCVTCHNPHGGGSLVNGAGATLTGGAKQMMRRSFSDNASTICNECHK